MKEGRHRRVTPWNLHGTNRKKRKEKMSRRRGMRGEEGKLQERFLTIYRSE